jgi:RNA polymerase sigma factor (sigma-70 family)
MIDIYSIIAEMNDKFEKVCERLTNNITDREEAVQELHLYFLTMNKQVLEDIYKKDGKIGILKYATVVLNRALTSTRSPFYYKYKKYYTNLVYTSTSTHNEINEFYRSIYNIPEELIEEHQYEKLEKIDKFLDNNIHWYESNIFKLYYYEGNTLDSLAKKTKISRNSLFTTIDKVREILKEELNE